MQLARRFRNLSNRYPFAGPLMWLLTFQFFIAEIVTANSWAKLPYSYRLNAISDLGAVGCGLFDDDRFVCSPLHGIMNGSLILLGITMAVGSVLLYTRLRKSKVGFSLMTLAGIGTFLVGIFPEDTVFWAHIVGQDLAFVLGNVALIVFGFTLPAPRVFRWYSITSGTVALVALVLFLSHHRLFLELGGMERTVAYPLLLWLIVAGGYFATRRVRN